jgi:hypothetical protein
LLVELCITRETRLGSSPSYCFVPEAAPSAVGFSLLAILFLKFGFLHGIFLYSSSSIEIEETEMKILEGSYELDEIRKQMNEHAVVSGIIAVNLDEIVGLDTDDFCDLLSEYLIGTTLLIHISYKVVGNAENMLFIEVSGDAQDFLNFVDETEPNKPQINEQVAVVIVDKDVVDELFICENSEKAEKKFLDECSTRISNWDEYTSDDIDAILDNGYEAFGNGSICIVHPTSEKD